MERIKIRRSVRHGDGFKNITERVTLISRTPKGVWVMLANGDKLHRKNKDII